ncbi:response regulator transcription factor [Tepidibacter formicigenes]|uniref:Stage 0 sporulation protein A homolog n=1 Tax=Tepidibacter formicigenes DSM 15518 TaxID=1123349 RepID=A0A1M6NI88_9FIRM|nr:response regulator transcription factor [Tepidibacter formicigenes]SHJ95419.1 DNA-binding response regulator, OmpR family, contains REC and winged-helix (wHTH) domain [Tepidibacter formicigenes DSM 15518]
MNINILIAEDEEDIRNLLVLHLSKEGYNVFEASNGIEALEIFYKEDIDLLLLDVMMPKIDGFKVLTKIRKTSQIPVIFLTARSEECDKVLGLGLGADDYVVKPFSIMEIVSRVQAHLRRYINYSSKELKRVMTNGNLTLDLNNYVLKKNDEILDLNPKEFKIISVFMENIGMVYTKKQLYELVWEDIYCGDDNTIMVHISHIREKIEDDPKKPKYLKTIRGIGYRMERCHG